MQLERQFAGPLQDTIIQRRPATCNMANTIGTLSCLPGPGGVKPMQAAAPAKPAPAPAQK
jgi:hypothetical protein